MKVVKEREGGIVRRVRLLDDVGEPVGPVCRFLSHVAATTATALESGAGHGRGALFLAREGRCTPSNLPNAVRRGPYSFRPAAEQSVGRTVNRAVRR